MSRDHDIPAADREAWSDGSHLRPFEVLGAHPRASEDGPGVCFAVWAPRARRVRIAGEFNGWDGRRHAMQQHGELWTLCIPQARIGERYRYEVQRADGRIEVMKADPFAFAAELRPGTASVIAELPPRKRLSWQRAEANAADAPISIYEVHLGSWRRRDDGGFLDWDTLARQLPDYAAEQGFTHVELMPVMEHPYDPSWGYQCLGLFAPTARFGSPDGLQRFVEACHAKGLGVLLDWVPAHFPMDEHGLARFDGEALYEYADPREGLHMGWQTLIYDFGKPEVVSLLAGSALYWVERFGVDGLRVDAVSSMLYRDYSRESGDWVPNVEGGRSNLEAIALLRRINDTLHRECPGAAIMAEESTPWPGVTAPPAQGGLGFDFKWNLGWMNDTLSYFRLPPSERGAAHERLSFSLVYAFDERFVLPLSHDEVVHGKGSLLQRMPGDEAARFAQLRALYALQWGHPGKKLLFMGQEFAQPDEWDFDRELPWQLLEDPRHAGVQKLVRALNAEYRQLPALHRRDAEAAAFEWLQRGEDGVPVFAWLRFGGPQDAEVMVVCHLGDAALPGRRVDARGRRWRVVLDTGRAEFGGEREVSVKTEGTQLVFDLPPFACAFLVAER